MKVNNEIETAIRVLNQGGIIIFPTDTAFGIGCRIDNSQSVNSLFKLRKRPVSQAVPVLVSSVAMAQNYLLSPLPNNVRRLMNDFWPGGVTVICECKKELVTPLVRGNGKNLGVRMPDSEKIIQIIKGAGVPILGPSANFHGEKTPFSIEDLNPELVNQVDFVLSGKCTINEASTVVDTTIIPWKILRQGKSFININKYII